MSPPERVAALCGGVGGAKLAAGLSRVLPDGLLSVIVNTADDFRHLGLHISPDVDTVLYTLAGIANPATGWGLAGDTEVTMRALGDLGGELWFHLGDRDLATHLARSGWLADGVSLTEVTGRLAARLGVRSRVLPMSDAPVATMIETSHGELAFQDWFVRRQCQPPAVGIRFAGAEDATPSDAVTAALEVAELIVLCPSNPYLSINPILALQGMRLRLRAARATVVAVSPIIAGRALKGPAATMLANLAGDASCVAVARMYADFLHGLVVDEADLGRVRDVQATGMQVLVTSTVMTSAGDRERLARETLEFARQLRSGEPRA